MTDTLDRQAEHAFNIANALDGAGFDYHEALSVLGIVVRLFVARVPADIRDEDIADWSRTFLHEPCPFHGYLEAPHLDA